MIPLPTFIYALLLAIAVGFGGGFYTEHKFDQADIVTKVVEARKTDAKDVVKSAQASAAVDGAVAASDAQAATVKKEVAAKPLIIYVKEKPDAQAIVVAGQTCPEVPAVGYLNVGAVRLLDSARSGAPADPAPISDEESRTASTVTPDEFAANDTEVVKLYKALAKRHDALVDFVDEAVKKQAKPPSIFNAGE